MEPEARYFSYQFEEVTTLKKVKKIREKKIRLAPKFRMMARMGFDPRKGLGKRQQGRKTPVKGISSTPRFGIGYTMRLEEVVLNKNQEMMKALIKFIKEGKEPSSPKPTIISELLFPASLNPLNLDLMPSLGEIGVKSDALPPTMEKSYRTNRVVDEPITIEELFNEEYINPIPETAPESLSHPGITKDEVMIMKDQVH